MLTKINWPAFFVVIIYPIFIASVFLLYINHNDIGWLHVALFITGYYGSNIAVGVGLHRLWAHNAFKANKFVEFVLLMLSAGTLQGPVLAWASDHYRHHTFTDKELDPHTPQKFQNRVLGFLWSHAGWMLVGNKLKSIDRVTIVKLGRNKLLIWQLKYYWYLAIFMNTILPAFVGFLIGGDLFSALTGYVFIGAGRALQQQATFCVNSLCHFVGTKNYAKGTAGDIWWMAPFLLGENWHNFHHAFPSDYRSGAKWFQLDIHKWIIYLMSKLNLAWDLDVTPRIRIEAKVNDIKNQLVEGRLKQLSMLQTKVESLKCSFHGKIAELEISSVALKEKFKNSYNDIHESLTNIAQQLQSSMQLGEKSSEKLLKIASNRVKDIEKAIFKLYHELEKYNSAFTTKSHF